MPRYPAPPDDGHPTKEEVTILRLLWERGPGTAEYIRDMLEQAGHGRTMSTVGRLLAAMRAKGLLIREHRRPGRYRPAILQAQMQQQLVTDFVNTAFSGLPGALVRALLETPLSADDLYDIRKAVRDRFERWDAPPR